MIIGVNLKLEIRDGLVSPSSSEDDDFWGKYIVLSLSGHELWCSEGFETLSADEAVAILAEKLKSLLSD